MVYKFAALTADLVILEKARIPI